MFQRLLAAGLTEGMTEEQPFLQWRFDFAWYAEGVALEVEGGTWSGKPCHVCGRRPGGRHNSAQGFREDCRKYNNATLDGWRVIRIPSEEIGNPETIEIIREALER